MTTVNEVMGQLPFLRMKKNRNISVKKNISTVSTPAAPEFSDLTRIIVSTDKLFLGTYQLAPGGSFNPPELHPGDETYYILDGTLTSKMRSMDSDSCVPGRFHLDAA
jgi:gentisate 1,2-dioxygenase